MDIWVNAIGISTWGTILAVLVVKVSTINMDAGGGAILDTRTEFRSGILGKAKDRLPGGALGN